MNELREDIQLSFEKVKDAVLKTTENYLASFEREERDKNAKLLTNFDDL